MRNGGNCAISAQRSVSGEAFDYYPLHEGHVTSRFCSITSCSTYSKLSFEELRLQDYQTISSRGDSRFGSVQGKCRSVLQPHGLKSNVRRACRTDASLLLPPVLIRVATESESADFILQQEVLMLRSEFFRAALKKDWNKEQTEGNTNLRVILLSDDRPKTFSVYVEWLFSNSIPTATPEISQISPERDTEYEELVLAYVLGDNLIDTRFKDRVIDAFVEKFLTEQRIDLELPHLIYEATTPKSTLRRLIVDIYVWHGQDWLKRQAVQRDFDKDFLLDLNLAHFARQTARPTANEPPYVLSTKSCHEHKGDAISPPIRCSMAMRYKH